VIPRRLLAFVALPSIALLAAGSWYGLRSLLPTYLIMAGVPYATLGLLYGSLTFGRAGAFLCGGILAAIAGPHVAAATGLGLCTAGLLVLSAASYVPASMTPFYAGVALATFGSGLATPGLWGAAAATFARPAHGYRDALFLLMYAAVQVGASAAGLSPLMSLTVVGSLPVPPFLAAAVLAGIGAVLAAGLVASQVALPPVPESDPSERFDGRPVALALGLAALAIAPWTGFTTILDQLYSLPYAISASAAPSAFVTGVNPVIVFLASVIGAAVAAALAALRFDFPTLPLVAAGLLLGALGGGIGAAAIPVSAALIPVAMMVASGGEALVTPLLMSRLTGDLHWRASALIVGGWLSATTFTSGLLSSLAQALGPANPTLPVLFAAAASSLGGVVILAVAIPHHRVLRSVLDGDRAMEPDRGD